MSPVVRVLVTGSSGHLGEALVRVLGAEGIEATGLDVLESPHTSVVGSIADRAFVRGCVKGVDAVLHAATLHKPHVGSHGWRDFVDTNVTGTLNLLEEAAAADVGSFVFTTRRDMSNWHGDYLGLATAGTEIYACWSDPRVGDNSHIYFAKGAIP